MKWENPADVMRAKINGIKHPVCWNCKYGTKTAERWCIKKESDPYPIGTDYATSHKQTCEAWEWEG